MLLRLAAQPDDRERHDAQQHRDREEILHEPQRVPRADDRDVEVGDEQQAVGLEVDRRQDEEAPHGEEVRDAGDGPLQQSGLPEHLFELSGDASDEVVFAAALLTDRLTRADQRGQPEHALGGEYQHDSCHQ